MVWRVRHNRQELERLGSRISAIILTTELGSGAVRRHPRAEAGARSAERFQSRKDLAGGLGHLQIVPWPTMLAGI